MARLHSCVRPFLSTQPVLSGKNANQDYLTQGRQGQGEVSMGSSHWLASHPEGESKNPTYEE
jgi:hypothetical protein